NCPVVNLACHSVRRTGCGGIDSMEAVLLPSAMWRVMSSGRSVRLSNRHAATGLDPLTSATNGVDRRLQLSLRDGRGDAAFKSVVGLDRLAARHLPGSGLTRGRFSGSQLVASASVDECPGPALGAGPSGRALEPVRRLDGRPRLASAP